jgi:methylated-DNA-[protein]-cysteine S-methyltransferase
MAYYDVLETALGGVLAGGSAAGLHRVAFVANEQEEAAFRARLERDAGEPAERDPQRAQAAVQALRAYFAGERGALATMPPLAPRGTPFQRRVWDSLLTIGWGETANYGTVAASIGQSAASRAVGRAVGMNPLVIVVPCHRVTAAGGAIGGYSSGLARKRWLLAHEGVGQPALV